MAYLRRLISRYRAPVIGVCISVCAIAYVAYANLLETITTEETIHVLPLSVTEDGWQNVEALYVQDVGEYDLLGAFSRRNSAYLSDEAAFAPPSEPAPDPDVSVPETSETGSTTGTVSEPEPPASEPIPEPTPEPIPEAEPEPEPQAEETESAEPPAFDAGAFAPVTTFISRFRSRLPFVTETSEGSLPEGGMSVAPPAPVVQTDASDTAPPVSEPIDAGTPDLGPSDTSLPAETGTTTEDEVDITYDEPVDETGEDPDEPISTTTPSVQPDSIPETELPSGPSIRWNGFSLPALTERETIANAQIRLSMAALRASDQPEGEPAPSVRIDYSMGNGAWQNAGTITIDDEVSNALNGGYYLFALPPILDPMDLRTLEVRAVYQGSGEAVKELFIDSLWIELSSMRLDREALKARVAPDALLALEKPEKHELISDTLDFTEEELPAFTLRYEEQRAFPVRLVRGMFAERVADVTDVTFTHSDIGQMPIPFDLNETNDGIWTIQLTDEARKELQPGTYTVDLTVKEGSVTFTDRFQFQWGLLAINTNRTEYLVGDTANISLAALSENGNTLCDARLELYAITEDDFIRRLPVDRSGLCNGNNVVSLSDYLSSYPVTATGTYELYVEHLAEDDSVLAHTAMTFNAVSDAPFTLERSGPTRIYPVAPYDMGLTLTARDSFTGTLTERVPAGFTVATTTTGEATVDAAGGTIRWDVTLAQGEAATLSYRFDAPDISPYLYELGPASLEYEITDARTAPVSTPEEEQEEIGTTTETELLAETVTEEAFSSSLEEGSNGEETEGIGTTTGLSAQDTATDTPTTSIDIVPSDVVGASMSPGGTQSFTEHRKWQVASDATGSMLLYWASTTIPTGWTCVSCTGSDAFFQRFVVGSSSAGVNGGTANHTHTTTGTINTTGAAGVSNTGGGGADASVLAHGHTLAPVEGNADNSPPYRNLSVIQHNSAGEPSSIPAGAIAMFDATVPAGWTQYSALNSAYPRGDATSTIGTTGGSTTHTHSLTGTTGASTVNTNAPGFSGVAVATNAHTHTINASSTSATVEPPYIEAIFGRMNATTTATDGMIAMWTDTPPTGWGTVSSSSEAFENRFVKASTTYGGTGGVSTHTHSDTTGIISSGPSATVNRSTNAANADASGSHTHTADVTAFSTASNIPQYRTAIFAKRAGGNVPGAPTQFTPFESEFTGTSTPSLEFVTTDPDGSDTLVYQVQWDDDENLDDEPIGSSTSDNEAGCLPNCFQNIPSPGDTNPFNENERIRFTIQNALTSGVTYYWRARAKETIGDAWGAWSETWSFTYVQGTDPAEWFQTEDAQFSLGTLSSAATSSDSVVLSVAQPSKTIVAYGEGVVTTPRYRTWNGTAWSAESSAADVGGVIQWVKLKANPVRDEYILGTQDASNDINFQVLASTSVWSNLIEVTTAVVTNTRRAFDVAYENGSGDAIAVYCGSGTDAQYRVWNGSSWAGPFNITTASGATCQYVQMASDPNSDEIIAVFRDTGAQYEALVWDGSAWGNSTTMGSMAETDNEGIAVEYEDSGDQALVVVSNGGGSSFLWNAWSGASWNGTAATVALGDDFEWGVLRHDVGTDNMALCYIDNDNDLGYMYWNGLSWQTPTTEVNAAGSVKTSRPISCEYETLGSRDGYLLQMYSDTTQSRYNYSTTSTPAGEANINSTPLAAVVGSVRASDGMVHAYFHNSGTGAYTVGDWNGSSWSTTTIETSQSVTAAPHREALGMAAQIYQPSSGSITSDPIDFDNVANQMTWGEVTWNTTEPAGTDVVLQVMTGPGCTTAIPNGTLAGNGAGFQATSSPLNISGLSTSTYNQICLKATFSSNNASNPALNDWRASWVREPVFTQTSYRWYANTNALTPIDPWPEGATDLAESDPLTEAYASKLGGQLRLRMAVQNANVTLGASEKAFTLEYATTTASVCDANRSWYEVGAIGSTTAAWRGYNNGAVSDGATLGSLLLTGTMTAATYEEQNDTSPNPNSIAVGNSLEFDWALENNAEPGTEYCFRMVEAGGALFAAYSDYPLLITNYEPAVPTLDKLFDNEKTATTTPRFEFSSADTEGNDVSYQIQIDDDATFGSVNVDRSSDVQTTQFSNLVTPADKDPFTSGERIEFRPTAPFTNGVTYYWRVRAKDPDGSNSWSDWSDVWSFTIDTSLAASAWFQTTDAQFATNDLDDTETSGSNATRLQVGFAVGTTTSDAIDFTDGTSGNAWGTLAFTDVETSSDLKYHIEYFVDDAWTLIPDSDLAGNSSGFDASPVSLLGLDTGTYPTIRLVAVLTDSGASPQLQDWTVNWGYKILPPTISMLFPNERMATTTPTFEFVAEDPQNDDLAYQIQWSTSYAFTASTTRTSSSSVGFANIDTGADTSPFFSGDTIQFTIQPADALTDNTTYWWRVRAVDPGGSNIFSAYTTPQSFTASSSNAVSSWFQTTQSQFNTDLLTGATTTVAGSVTVATTAVETLIAYAEGTVQTPRYRTWDGTTLSTEGSALSVGSPISWVVARPGATREEYLLGTLGTDGDVNVQVYADGTWGDLQEVTASVPNTTARGFDIAYETISGDALAVSCDGDDDPTYYIWNGTSWTLGGSVNFASSNSCAWIKMASDPASDEIALVGRDSSGVSYELFVWSGSSWGNNTNLGTMNEAGHEGISLAYEESGNQLVVITSNGTNASMSWKAWNGSSWTATSTVALGDDFEAGTLAADVGSDNMVFCYVDEDNDIGAMRWTGAAWTATTELEIGWAAGNTVKNDRPVDCAFEVGGARDGYIMVVYSDTTNVRYRYWDGAIWQAEASVSTVQDAARVQIARTGGNLLQSISYDITNNRYDYSYWNGSTWSAFQTTEASGVSGGYPYKEPFMIAVREPGSTGSIVGAPPVDFYDGSGPYWQQLSWVNTRPGASTILYRVQYYDTASSSWKDIPNSLIPGNSSGTSTGPIDLRNVLPVSTYSLVRPVASLTCVLTNCPSHNDWTLTWAPGINISGTAQQYNQSTNLATGTVHVALNGVLQSGKTGTISGGAWSVANVNAAQGDTITVFIDNVGDSGEAVAVTTYDGIGDISGMNLYQRHLSIGSDDHGTTTNAQIGLYDRTNDEDLFSDVSSGTLTVCASGEAACQDGEIIVKALNTYQPGSNAGVITHDFENNGTFAPNGNTIRVNGSWDNNGTTTMATSTVIFTATSTIESIDSTGAVSAAWNNVTMGETSGTATWNASSSLDIDGTLAVNFGTFARGSQTLTVAGNLNTGANGFWTGIASTTFDGTLSANWSDANAAKQNIGYAVIDGSTKTVTLTGNVAAQTVTIGQNDTLDANTPTSYDVTVYGNWINQNVWNARSGEVIFAATTTGRTIALAGASFYDLTFNGAGGAWSFASSTLTVSNDLSIATGTVTLPTGTTTIAGSLLNTGGTFQHNNGEVRFTSTGAETIALNATAFTNGFYDLTFNGAGGTWNMTGASATTSNNVRIFAGTPTFPSTRMSIGGSFLNSGGSFNGAGGELRFYGSAAKTITAGGGTFGSLRFDSTSTSTLTDTNITALGSLSINAGTTTMPTGTFTLGGSLTNAAAMVHSSGTVLFNSTDQGETISMGASIFYNATMQSTTGGWTVLSNATATNAFTISSAASFTLQSGRMLAVGGAFTNAVNGASTTWDGSTLMLISGTTYQINTSATAGDRYDTLVIGSSTRVSMWNSSATTTNTNANAYLYSQDHAAADGDLYIYGAYTRTSGTEYWNVGRDFDGTTLATSSMRQVDVRFAPGATASFSDSVLSVVGTSSASTTVAALSGTYTIDVSGGTTTMQHYDLSALGATGLTLGTSTVVTSLMDGRFVPAAGGGSGLRVASSTIDANPALQIERVEFSTTTAISATNVTQFGGAPASYWWFRSSTGNLDGEAFDNDTGNPGSIRWDDSAYAITVSGNVYSDAGVTPMGAPTCDGVALSVRIVVNAGSSTHDGTCAPGTGAYSIPGVTFVGDPTLTIFLNTNGGARGTVVTKTPTGDMTGMHLYQNRVITRHQDILPLTIADMSHYDDDDDSDISFNATTSASTSLAVRADTELLVYASTTFTPGGAVTLQPGGTGNSYDATFHIDNSATATASGTEAWSVGGRFQVDGSGVFVPASSTVTMTATSSGKTISSPGTINFNTLTFSGTGSWSLVANLTVANNLNMNAGALSGSGNIDVAFGSMSGNGTVALTGGTTTVVRSNALGGTLPWQFYNLTMGNGSVVGTTTPSGTATTTVLRALTVSAAHTLAAGASRWDLRGTGTPFTVAGNFDEGTSQVRYGGDGATTILGDTYYDVDINAASGTPTFTTTGTGILIRNTLSVGGTAPTILSLTASDPVVTVAGNLYIRPNGTLIASDSATLTARSGWDNDGTFTPSGGTVAFTGATSTTVMAGQSAFANVVLNGDGTHTFTENATATAAFTITQTGGFTVNSGTRLAVGGTFSNNVNGALTTWTGSTLSLYSGTSFDINPKSTDDQYGTLSIEANTDPRMWNGTATSISVNPSGSLYSMDHGNSTGSLYIYGEYGRSSGTDYWSYATDFDGTALGGASRKVDVAFASGASAYYTGGGLWVMGTTSASTTVTNQGSGTYALTVGGTASTTMRYYEMRDMASAGVVFTGTPNVVTISNGEYVVSQPGGTAITVGGTAITQNPAKTFSNNRFATTTMIAANNVTATGTTVSSWRFTNEAGNISGEAYDVDPGGDPGYIVWTNSAANITVSGRVYSDEGVSVSSVCDGSTNAVRLVVAGVTTYDASCAVGTGLYSISNISYSANDTITVFLNGVATRAAVVTVDPVSSISNMDLYENRVIVRHENTDPITIADIAAYDSVDDADIPFTAVNAGTDTLTLPANRKLIVWSGKTFAPAGNVTLSGGGGGAAYDGTLELFANAAFTAAGTETHSVGGNMILGTNASLDAAQSTFTMTTTGAGRTIDVNQNSFYNLVMNGAGSWTVSDPSMTVSNDMTITTGALTLPSGTTTVGGSFANNGGSFTHATGTLAMTATVGGKTLRMGGSTVNRLIVNGVGGAWSMTDTNATTTLSVDVANGTLTLPSGTFRVGSDFTASGTITHNNGTLRLTGTTTTGVLRSGGSTLNNVMVDGTGAYTMVDSSLALAGSLTLQSGTTTFATNTLSIAGSLTATGGSFLHASGTVLMNSTDAGETVAPGNSRFYNLTFQNAAGGWTISSNATTTNNFTLSSAASFRQASSTTLEVSGVFTNLVGGSPTNWDGSTLLLATSASYAINLKATTGDRYNILSIASSTDVSVWNSNATTTLTGSNGSLYSMDHGAVDGELSIFGDYERSSGTDYWNYAIDFDGTVLVGGARRAVTVRHAQNATTTMRDTATLNIVGDSTATTTVTNQGSGTYGIRALAGTMNLSNYRMRNLGAAGVELLGTTTVSSLSNGDWELAVASGSLITVASSTVNANASAVHASVRFATTTPITGANVTLIGTTSAAWTFTNHSGNLAGESYDVDGGDACGSIRWSDSSCLLLQQAHYRWRNDDGGEAAPNSEWYDTSWTRRQRVVVTNADATAYTNAAVKVTVPFDSDMQTTFGDLRFTSADGTTLLSHWTERYTASNNATVWVEVPTLAASSDTSIFMYYGNTLASDASNGTTTFIAFDDFEDDNIAEYGGDTGMFNVGTAIAYDRTYGLDAQGSENAQTTDGIYRTGVTVSRGETIRYFQYINTTTGSTDEACALFGAQSPGANNNNYAVCLPLFGVDRVTLARNVSSNETSGAILSSSTITYATGWHEVEVDWRTDNTIYVSVYRDNALVATTSAADSNYSSGGIGFSYWFQHGGWDAVSSRPYMTTDPTTRFGVEQTRNGASWLAVIDTFASSFTPSTTARVRFGIENTGLAVTNKQFRLEYAVKGVAPSCESVGSGSYTAVPIAASCGSSPICMTNSANVTDLASTTDQLGGAGQYTYGQTVEDASNKTSALNLGAGTFTEVEYAIIPTSNAVSGAYCLRVTDNGAALDGYTRVAEMRLRYNPTVTSVVLNSGNDIIISPGATTTVSATATIMDLNGYADMTQATATIYRSGVSGAGSCTADNNNCYRVASSSCLMYNCSGYSCTLSCSADIYYFADPTDIGTYASETWSAFVSVVDSALGYGTGVATMPKELNTVRALEVTHAINYASLESQQDSGAANATTTVTNIGNDAIDISIVGTNLTSGSSTIPVNTQKYATSTFTYSSCTVCTLLGTTSSNLEVDLTKPMDTSTVADDVFWGISIPFGVAATAHQGQNTFYAIGD